MGLLFYLSGMNYTNPPLKDRTWSTSQVLIVAASSVALLQGLTALINFVSL